MAMHNDEQIVQRIIDEKTRSGQYKEHPDAPGDVTAMMFYVLVDLESVAEDEHEDRVSMEVSGDTHGDQVPFMLYMFVWSPYETIKTYVRFFRK